VFIGIDICIAKCDCVNTEKHKGTQGPSPASRLLSPVASEGERGLGSSRSVEFGG
jgi:hypothetical protein